MLKIAELAPDALGSEVTVEDLARVIELWTGIPASRIQESELKKLADLENVLASKVIGQKRRFPPLLPPFAAVRSGRISPAAVLPPSFLLVLLV